MMLAGAIPTAMLAIAIDSVVGAVSYVTVPKGCNPIRARQ